MNIYEEIDKNKSAIDGTRPFEGDMLKQLREYYRIGLTWTSNSLEGNSLTETETKVLLEDGLTVGGKPLRDTFEALGHSAAYDFMFSLLHSKTITIENIKTFHKLFYSNINVTAAGVWRNKKIIVTGSEYKFPAPCDLNNLMNGLAEWANENRPKMNTVKFAAELHLHFVSIHPFIDGNGRVARLLMNTVLIQDGYMIAIIPPVLRIEYLNAIKAYQLRGDKDTFNNFIAERVLESEREIMRLLSIK